jgi:hypothetical protein
MKKLFTILFILLLGNSAFAQNLYGDMEQWRNINSGFPPKAFEAPAGWYGVDSLIAALGPFASVSNPQKMLFKDADAHSGSFAAKIMTRFQGGQLDTLTGVLVNAMPGFDLGNFDPSNPAGSLTYTGGTATTSRMESVSAWIKYLPRHTDKGRISARAMLTGKGAGGTDSIVGTADTILSQPIMNYTQVTINMKYQDTTVRPDKLLVLFYSSNMTTATSPYDSSTMYVDDVSAKAAPVSVKTISARKDIKIYPNPAADRLFISTNDSKYYEIVLYNSTGSRLSAYTIDNKGIDISPLPTGLYYYSIGEAETVLQQGMFTIER